MSSVRKYGEYGHKLGYIQCRVWIKGKRKIFLKHRLIMEIYLKRKLKRSEDVHHRDGDKGNNTINNLEILSHGAHSVITNKERWARYKAIQALGLILLACSMAHADSANVRAHQIARVLKREGARPNVAIIAKTIREIDRNIPKYFPKGPFTREDFIAIAMTESRFNKHCVGSSGEKGIFQVMPMHWTKGNPSDVAVNTQLAFQVMSGKLHEHHGDKRKAVIGFNGYVVRNGKLIDRYWLAFLKQRNRMANV